MSNGNDEENPLAARFEEHAPGKAEEDDQEQDASDTENTGNTDNTGVEPTSTSSSTSGSTRGPDPDSDSLRQSTVNPPTYVTEQRREALDSLYNRLDGADKLAGGDGIEKHAEFWDAATELILEHEQELAEKLDVEIDE